MDGEVQYIDIVRYEGDVGFGYAFTRLDYDDGSGRWFEIKQPIAMLPNGDMLDYMLQGVDREHGEIMPDGLAAGSTGRPAGRSHAAPFLD